MKTKNMPHHRTYSISELAKEFDITTRTIRFYEQQGLLSPTRQGQTRIYNEKDRVRLMLTLRGKRLGFSLAETRELFELYDTTRRGDSQQLQRMLKILERKRHDLEQQMSDIRRLQSELDAAETRCREALAELEYD